MRILTRSRQIRKALRALRARIPAKDWQTISAFLSRVRAETAWRISGIGEAIDPISAALQPLYTLNPWILCGAEIVFVLPIYRLYTDSGMIGVAAHEFAHALRAARHDDDWPEKMGERQLTPAAIRKYEAEERRANAIASSWGFRAQIRAMREERGKFVNPYIRSHEIQIRRHIQQRDGYLLSPGP